MIPHPQLEFTLILISDLRVRVRDSKFCDVRVRVHVRGFKIFNVRVRVRVQIRPDWLIFGLESILSREHSYRRFI